MSDSVQNLTAKQQHYLSLLQQSITEKRSVASIASQHDIDPSLLYAARKVLQEKGVLPSSKMASVSSTGFQSVPLSSHSTSSVGSCIELKTQLPNGQPIWLSVPAAHVGAVLKALSL